jgi:integrase
LVFVDHDKRIPEHLHPELDAYLDLADQERARGVTTGTPIVVSPEFDIDPWLVAFFTQGPLAAKSALTKDSYARGILNWCAFLWGEDLTWVDATATHYYEYRRWRTDKNLHPVPMPGERPVHISEASFDRTHHALKALYDWAVRVGHVEQSPVPETRSPKSPTGSHRPVGHASRPDRFRWVTPATYQVWRNVGLLGHEAVRRGRAVETGPPLTSWRGHNTDRDTALTDLMITSALRSGEQRALLLSEVPDESVDVRLAAETAKYRKGRIYTPLPLALERVHRYIDGERARAVRRAQAAGRYEDRAHEERLLVVQWSMRGRRIVYEAEDGRVGTLADLTPAERSLTFVRDAAGQLEPQSLWLKDDGSAMNEDAWKKVFRRANGRVLTQWEAVGANPSTAPWISSHSLRFSFALYLLAALHRRIDERDGRDPHGPYDERNYETAYDIVRDMLGHASVTTTKDTYLEPVKRLRSASLFDRTAMAGDLSEVIAALVGDSDRVLDTGTVFESED